MNVQILIGQFYILSTSIKYRLNLFYLRISYKLMRPIMLLTLAQPVILAASEITTKTFHGKVATTRFLDYPKCFLPSSSVFFPFQVKQHLFSTYLTDSILLVLVHIWEMIEKSN